MSIQLLGGPSLILKGVMGTVEDDMELGDGIEKLDIYRTGNSYLLC
jgi:hypothetical protein